MAVRTARKGQHKGRKFYGCTNYPECKGIRLASTINESYIDEETEGASGMDKSTREKLKKLIKYYRECVSIENLSDISFWESRENKDFIQCPADVEWMASEKETFEMTGKDALYNLGSEMRWRRRPSYHYAYPVFVQKYRERHSGREKAIIKPLLIFPVDVEKDSECLTAKRTDYGKPRINTSLLSSGYSHARPEFRKEFVQKILELWDEEDNNGNNFKKIFNELITEFGEIKFLNDGQIFSEKINIDEIKTGFYSTGILFVTQGSTYTYGLEEELKNIEIGLNEDVVSKMPVIEAILNRNKDKSVDKDKSIIEIMPLNDEQREGVNNALNNTLSIITGPPGTGKSQVVINIIANAVAKGQSVLFGSKNHQAVDVVLARISDVQAEPIVLKFGQNTRESVFAEKLLASVDKTLSMDPELLDKRIQELSDELDGIFNREKETWKELDESYSHRNKINKVEAEMAGIYEKFPKALKEHIPENVLLKNTAVNSRKLIKLIRKAENNSRDIGTLFLNLFGVTLSKRILSAIKKVMAKSQYPEGVVCYFDISKIKQNEIIAYGKLFVGLLLYTELQSQSLFLRSSKGAAADTINDLKNELLQLQKQKCEISPEYVDQISSKKLKQLSSNERNKISDYVSTIRRIEEDRVGGEIVGNLRKEKKNLFSSVVNAFPALAVTNLSVRHVVPLKTGIIDLVVIDEASQCDIASALPMLVRAKRAVIIGDDQQLIHVSNIDRISDQQIQSKYDLKDTSEQRFLYSPNSLFDLCKTTVGTSGSYIMLKDHYRSRKEIIDFSNRYFYGNSLKVWTDYRQLKISGDVEGIVWHDIKGKVIRPSSGSVYNLAEAGEIINVLKQILPEAKKNDASIGIVTPFRAQENKIKDLLMRAVDINTIEQLHIKIDTAHGYQGDERDIMIFSPVVSEGMLAKTKRFLINTQNLFNVAITRPRAQLHIVGDREACARSNVDYLEKFVKYVDNLKIKTEADGDSRSEIFGSDWEKLFYEKLNGIGIKTIPQYAIHQYNIDLAIDYTNPPIAIEIDGEAYHREITGERCVSDIKRDIRLNLMGWIVKRFWVYELKYDMGKCLEEIRSLVKPSGEVAK